jgi:signal transduction histidine kinase
MNDEPAMASAPSVDDLAAVLQEYMAATGRLQQTHQVLQQEVVRLRQELAGKDRELELRRRLAALVEMAAGVAHEVRNPLGAIQLYNGLLRKQCQAHRLAPALQLIEKIEAGIQAIEAVVQDTLALVPRDRKLGVCRLAEIVQRVQDATCRTLSVCRVALQVAIGDEELCVRADADGLQRVLINLVVNAAEASPPGRTVWLECGRVGVSGGVGVGPAKRQVAIHVQDEGSGVPDGIRDRIFDPFFTTKQRGTGLGLTIAHRLVEAYGGQLTVTNRPAGGAEFTITLPASQADGPRSVEALEGTEAEHGTGAACKAELCTTEREAELCTTWAKEVPHGLHLCD